VVNSSYMIFGAAGQMLAMMCVPVSAEANCSTEFTCTRFSCQRRLAHVLMSYSGANLVTTTQSNRAFLRIARDANSVFL
jgi:hypothetical protein